MNLQLMSKRNAAIGVSCALLLPIGLVGASSFAPDSNGWLYSRETFWWLIAGLVAFWALRREGLSWSDLGVHRPNSTSILWGVVVAVASILTIGLCYAVIIPALGGNSDPAKMQAIAARPIALILFLSITAGIVEEWLFRFYAINRLHFLSNNKWLASIIAGTVFITLHAPSWGFSHLIPVTLVTLIFTAYYWWRRDFWSSALAHFLTDAVPFVMTALILRDGQ